MTYEMLHGRQLTRTIEAVQIILSNGEVRKDALRGLEGLDEKGLWSSHGDWLVATHRLFTVGDRLPNAPEAVAAVFALVPDIRQAWLRIVRARLAEAGERKDIAALVDVVTTTGEVAGELLRVTAPSLGATMHSELERVVLPTAAHEAAAFPVLLRVLAATASLPADTPSMPMPEIVFDDPSTAWRPGRLLRLPTEREMTPSHVVLSGTLNGRTANTDAMHWALHHPWAFLLAQMTFTQEAWEAERCSGGVAFELDAAQVPLFQSPPRVEVVVTLPNSDEVQCGTLGEFAQRVVADLGVTLIGYQVKARTLDDKLPIVIDHLQRHDVWQFRHGSGGRRGGYRIHALFSDACYRTLGCRAFYRLGAPVTAAIRRVAETWAGERRARAAAARAGEAA